jgi:hypothetical protein
MQRPYYRCSDKSVNNNDPMYMIWHNNEYVQIDKRKMNRYLIPHLRCNLSNFRQLHFTIDNITKPFSLHCCTYCNKIFPWKRVIPASITQRIVSESIPEQRAHESQCSYFKQDTKLLCISKTLMLNPCCSLLDVFSFQTVF